MASSTASSSAPAFILQSLSAGHAAQAGALAQMYVAGRTDAALAWADLSWLAMRNGHLDQARQWLLAGHDSDTSEPAVMEGLCELAWREGDLPRAQQWGRAALDAKSARSGPPVPPAPVESEGSIDVISFSLFGTNPWYGESAVQTVTAARSLYPGWQCVVYVDEGVSPALQRRLEAAGAALRPPPPAWAHLPGTVWRFAALDEPQARRVLMRDVDSPPTPREAAAVQAWLQSGRAAHVMRDHWVHCELVLAGLWGCHAAHLRGVGEAISSWFGTPRHDTHADQHFLREWAWPRIAADVLQHDRCFRWRGAVDFPDALPDDDNHAGSAPSIETVLALSGAPAPSGTVTWDLKDAASGALLGRYASPFREGHWAIRLPPSQAQALQSGALVAVPVKAIP
ncbi:MAG: hypothetical protein EOO28_14000 [Comamonadaceae bacterium]|nr:MAG: hypothetical protein EOO28_14000 [Comamonadaceae bacterium]